MWEECSDNIVHAFSINLFSEIHADQNSSCTEGFLSDQALRMIATPSFQESNPVFEHSVSTSSAHSSRQHIIPSMMIATSGLLTKILDVCCKIQSQRGRRELAQATDLEKIQRIWDPVH